MNKEMNVEALKKQVTNMLKSGNHEAHRDELEAVVEAVDRQGYVTPLHIRVVRTIQEARGSWDG